ncbi:MAG: fatty acid desaturase [Hyphomicrobium sp.]|nr:fatty acid desaturase [Hyphomicrobium sp.]
MQTASAAAQPKSASLDSVPHDRSANAIIDRAAQELNTEALKVTARRMALHCMAFRGADNRRAIQQIVTTTIPFVAIVAAMFATVDTHYWLTLMLAIPAGGLLVRYFIIQHDCGHGSFFSTTQANTWTGRAISLLTITPYGLWRREHAQHHAGSGHLEKRGVGDIKTLTIAEYEKLSPLQQLGYRIYRHPLFLFGFGVPFYFAVIQRLPWLHPYPPRDTWSSVMGLNVVLVAVWGTVGWFVGYDRLFWIAWPMLHIATAVGGWLFFIQHQFEDTVWDGADEWSFQVAALHGSSYYVLHPVLNWFTGSIGLHHIHHLNSMIPNYKLDACLAASQELQSINRLTLFDSLSCARLKLWDEAGRRLVTFEEASTLRA